MITNTSYFEGQNLAWAKSMVTKLDVLRDIKP